MNNVEAARAALEAARAEAFALWADIRENNSSRPMAERRAAMRKANAASQRLKAARAKYEAAKAAEAGA